MTWYANEIIMPATKELIDFLRNIPELASFFYWINDLNNIEWYHPNNKHNLPENGLIFIQPLENILSNSIQNKNISSVLKTTSFNIIIESFSTAEIILDSIIEKDIRNYNDEQNSQEIDLNDFNAMRYFIYFCVSKFNIPALYYSCSMWGGDIEEEYSLIYTFDNNKVNEKWVVSDLLDSPNIENNALMKGLKAIGVSQNSFFFAPHSRSFFDNKNLLVSAKK